MTWFLLSLGSGIADAFQNLFRKKQVTKLDPLSLSWLLFLFASIAFLPLWRERPEHLSGIFWLVIALRTVLDTAATYLFLRSVELTDLSLSVPITAFSPVFIVAIEFLLTGSIPSLIGFIGIACVASGAYLLNIESAGKGIFALFSEMFRNKGMFLMLCVAILWSVTSTLHRVAILESNAPFYLSIGSLLLFVSFTTVLLAARGKSAFSFLTARTAIENMPAGVFGMATNLLQMTAQGLFLASYVIAIKRTSILFSSILGWLFLKEKIGGRIFPACIMVAGVILLAIS